MKLCVYGGAFNPPHRGHIALARAAMETLRPDTFLWMPSGDPPHKRLAENSPAVHHRLAMTQLAASEVEGTQCSDLEIRHGLRYTADTLALLHKHYAPTELWLLVGGDMFRTLEQWRSPETLFSLASIAVFPRETNEWELLEHTAESLRARFQGQIRVCRHNVVVLSSTKVRAAIPAGESIEHLSGSVYDYICAETLYGMSRAQCLSLPSLRREIQSRLCPRRAAHVLATEETAARLACHFSVSEFHARQGALLHDITKEERNQLNLFENCDILPDVRKNIPPSLYHAWTAAALAQSRGAEPPVVEAVRYHSTGRPGMSILEAIIYLSDKIEPTRTAYEDLDQIRSESCRDLRNAMLLSLRRKAIHLRAKGIEPSEDAQQTYAWLAEHPSCFNGA